MGCARYHQANQGGYPPGGGRPGWDFDGGWVRILSELPVNDYKQTFLGGCLCGLTCVVAFGFGLFHCIGGVAA